MVRAADQIAAAATGHRLCTAMRFDAATMTAERLHCSDAISYQDRGKQTLTLNLRTAEGRAIFLDLGSGPINRLKRRGEV